MCALLLHVYKRQRIRDNGRARDKAVLQHCHLLGRHHSFGQTADALVLSVLLSLFLSVQQPHPGCFIVVSFTLWTQICPWDQRSLSLTADLEGKAVSSSLESFDITDLKLHCRSPFRGAHTVLPAAAQQTAVFLFVAGSRYGSAGRSGWITRQRDGFRIVVVTLDSLYLVPSSGKTFK